MATICAGSRRRWRLICAAMPRSLARMRYGRMGISNRTSRPASIRAAACSPRNARAPGSRWTFRLSRRRPRPRPEGLAEALGATPKYVGKNAFDYLVELDSEKTVRRLTAEFHRACEAAGARRDRHQRGCRLRFHFPLLRPGSGITEDPVTGSAHCCLGPFWSERLGKTEFVAYQASARGGVVYVRLEGDRVRLGGQAVTVLRGTLLA